MKVSIPEKLKDDLPPTLLGKILGATPVVMTVIATMLAGLSSSEMTRAQYDRSLAAQLQSKAGDQWSFFQAKRMRGSLQRSTYDLLTVSGDVPVIPTNALIQRLEATPAGSDPALDEARKAARTLLENGEAISALDMARKGELPDLGGTGGPGSAIKAALEAGERAEPDDKVGELVSAIPAADLDRALADARRRALAFDAAVAPVAQALERADQAFRRLHAASVGKPDAGPSADAARSVAAARLNFAAARYDAEAKLNQSIAAIYELKVRQSNFSADRHFRRSAKFFYGMLVAQLAVILATFAMVARQKNLLWLFAAFAGVGAVLFAVYVYLNS